jgi:hypothetical protein
MLSCKCGKGTPSVGMEEQMSSALHSYIKLGTRCIREVSLSSRSSWPHGETRLPEDGGYVAPGVGLDAAGTAGNKRRLSGCPASHRLLSEISQFDSA